MAPSIAYSMYPRRHPTCSSHTIDINWNIESQFNSEPTYVQIIQFMQITMQPATQKIKPVWNEVLEFPIRESTLKLT